ncbi:MAG: substrate-binding domain-containing protein [Oscillospiraceae bacterium]
MKATKVISIFTAAMMLAAFTGCSNGTTSESGSYGSSDSSSASADNSSKESKPDNSSEENKATLTDDITVISREEGSGTRGAFVELMGIQQENDKGEKEDMTTENAEITSSTSVVLQSVADNKDAIGYISLGSLNDSVKAVKVDGVEPSVEDILNGSYAVARPFVVCYKEGELSELAADFMTFIMSEQGQAIITENGYISEGNDGAYTGSGKSGSLTLSGSTSVSPVMEKIADAYKEINPDTVIEVQQTGSGAGITAATEGACDIGMSSRALKDSELEKGLTAKTIANDGIAVIVNHENPVDDLSSEQIMKIYTGEITNWAELG